MALETAEPFYLEDHPSGTLLVLGVLLGQHDGKTFLSDAALLLGERMQIRSWRDDSKGGWWVALDAGGE